MRESGSGGGAWSESYNLMMADMPIPGLTDHLPVTNQIRGFLLWRSCAWKASFAEAHVDRYLLGTGWRHTIWRLNWVSTQKTGRPV